MRRVLPFVLLTVLIAPAAASAQQGPPFPDAAREWLSRDLPFRFQAMIALGDSLFNNGSCTRCHGDDATGTRRAPDLTDAEWVQSEGDLEGIFQTIFWGVRRRDFADETRRFEMNPQGGMNITWDQTRALAAYVWSLTSMPVPAGR